MRVIPLTQGYEAIVDDTDYEYAIAGRKWQAKIHGNTVYATRTAEVNGRRFKQTLHRFLLGITDPAIKVDHIDRNGLNNRRSNLRICNMTQNQANAGKRRGTSCFKGVHLRKDNSKWRAKCGSTPLGTFETEIEAALAYDRAARALFGKFARPNFPAAA